jgi:hypothetical protein
MGWDGIYLPNTTREEFIQHEFGTYYNIKASNWKGTTWFAAAESKVCLGKVFALIVLTRKEGDWWYKKSMDEGSGPYETGASKAVMQALSPVEDLFEAGSYGLKWAHEWRKKQAAPQPKPIKVGQWIKTQVAIKFSNGKEYDEFQKAEPNNRMWNTRDGLTVKMRLSKFLVYQPL